MEKQKETNDQGKLDRAAATSAEPASVTVKLEAEQFEALRSKEAKLIETQFSALLRALTPSSPIATDSTRRLIDAFNALKR